MDTAITGFAHALRAAGVPVSTAETLDAARTAGLLGWNDRAALREAFGLVFAKSTDDKTLHDEVFDRYFSASTPESAADETVVETETPTTADETDMSQQLELERAAQAAGVDGIRWSTQIGIFTMKMLQEMGRENDPEWFQKARAVVQRRFELYGAPSADAFMDNVLARGPFGRLTPSDYPRLKAAIARMAARWFSPSMLRNVFKSSCSWV